MEKIAILLSGKQGAGKTTMAAGLEEAFCAANYGVRRFKFADPLYEMHGAIAKILAPYGYEPRPKWGPLLQYLGTEFGREQLDKNIWVNILKKRVENTIPTLAQSFRNGAVAIIDDLRFKNEWLEEGLFGGIKIIRVRLEAPWEARKRRCENWRPTTDHPSETDLDDWVDKFDHVIDTQRPFEMAFNNLKSQLSYVHGFPI